MKWQVIAWSVLILGVTGVTGVTFVCSGHPGFAVGAGVFTTLLAVGF